MPSHEYFMQQALLLAEQARFQSPPNPWVGCVIVKKDQIIGKGYTQSPGQAHAEICALQQAQENAKGASLYVTLEPCAHIGRTGPCANAIIRSGIREVYVAIEDPDSRVKGVGIHLLQQAGIKVFQGICAQEAQHLLIPYLYQRRTGLPYTTLKTAISLDGCTAAMDGTSQWITNVEAREDVHKQRALSQAIVIGARTALKDLPQLTVRHPIYKPKYPLLRVLLDAQGQVPAQGPLFDSQLAPTLVITTAGSSQQRRQEWEKNGAEVVLVSSSSKGVNLQEAWKLLGERSILQVLVEGGSTLHTALLETSLFHRLMVYIGPILLGPSALPFYQKQITTLQQAQRLHLDHVEKLGDCVRLDYQKIECY